MPVINDDFKPNGSGWTFGTLYAHLNRLIHETDRRYEERFEGQEKAVAAALAAQEKAVAAALAAAALAVDKAEANSEKWRANANEWRGAMDDREEKFMDKGETEARLTAMDRQLGDLKRSRDTSEGRIGGLSAGWGYLVGAIGLAATVIAIVVSLSQ